MKVKYYKVYEDEIMNWWWGLDPGISSMQYSPWEIIDDLKTGRKEWSYKRVRLKLKPRK